MKYRIWQQIKIIFVLVVFLALIATGIYFIYIQKTPTCFDGIQNQDEAGIDCGGSCVSCEITTIKQPEVLWAKAYFLKDNLYDLVASVSNVNPNYGLVKFNYVFKYYDSADNLLGEKKGSSFILPRQTKYIFDGNMIVESLIGRVELIIDKIPGKNWFRLKNGFEIPNIFSHDIKFKLTGNQNSVAEVSGIIKNDSDYDFDRVGIVAILLDSQKNIIGFNKTEARTVLAGEERYFSALWFNEFSVKVEKVLIETDTNLFLQENFIKRYGAQEKFQEIPD